LKDLNESFTKQNQSTNSFKQRQHPDNISQEAKRLRESLEARSSQIKRADANRRSMSKENLSVHSNQPRSQTFVALRNKNFAN